MSNVISEIIGGKYDILSKLGQGGSGVVYLAKKLGTNERYAIKTLSTEEDNAIKLLSRETETLKRWLFRTSYAKLFCQTPKS